ncbi:MAG TPA: MFS transporter, partial [Euryarchaeota archaeon]|nr:MFS transporter [Euryarchaeota archaeon]
VAGVASYWLPTLESILVARFILGIGIAGITSTVTALIAEYYGGIQRVKVLSYQSAAMGIGVLILEFTGGTLAEISWRTPFLVYLIGIPILIMAILSMREPRMSEHDKDEIADIVAHEKFRKADYKIVALCYVSIFFCMNLVFLLPTSIPIVLSGLGVSSSIVGLFLGFHGVANAVFSILYRRITARIPPFRILGLGFLCMGVGFAVLILWPSVPLAIFTLIITGVGVGMIVPSLVNTLAGEVTGSNSGSIMGGYGTCLNFGQFAISLLSVPLLALLHDSYYEVYCLMGVIAILYGIVITVWSLRYYRRRQQQREAAAATD